MDDDFSPILDQGDVEAPGGIKSRFTRRAAIPIAVEAGVSRVLVSSEGVFVSEDSQSLGERVWGRAQRWVKVDVSPHPLAFELPLLDPAGRGDFIVKISVMVTVSDPAIVARKGLKQARSYVEPALRMAVAGVKFDEAKRASMSLRQLPEDTANCLSALVNQPLGGVPDGLTAVVAAVSVEFDSTTSSHLAALTEQAHRGEQVDAKEVVEAKLRDHDITKRNTWRDALGAELSDPQQRLIELAITDPSREGIAQFVEQANALESANRDSFVRLLTLMIEKDYVERDDPLYKAAVSLLQSLQSEAKIPMLGASEPQRRIAGGDDPPADVIEHDAVPTDEDE